MEALETFAEEGYALYSAFGADTLHYFANAVLSVIQSSRSIALCIGTNAHGSFFALLQMLAQPWQRSIRFSTLRQRLCRALVYHDNKSNHYNFVIVVLVLGLLTCRLLLPAGPSTSSVGPFL